VRLEEVLNAKGVGIDEHVMPAWPVVPLSVVGRHRQVERFARSSAVEFEAFYTQRHREGPADSQLVDFSADGKGVAMRSVDLRHATAKAQAEAAAKLNHCRSKGEKHYKWMAEVAAVSGIEVVPRSPAGVLLGHDGKTTQAPKATDKRRIARVVDVAASVIAEAFCEAEWRDLEHARTWVALVDGNNHRISRINAEAKLRKVKVTIEHPPVAERPHERRHPR